MWRIFNRQNAGKRAGGDNGKGYVAIRISPWPAKFKAHRIIWALVHGEWPPAGFDVDHINMIKGDNRPANLRLATRGQNIANRVVRTSSGTGFKGVVRSKMRFAAKIKAGGKMHYIGQFKTPEEAHAAYVEAAKRLHGEFARA